MPPALRRRGPPAARPCRNCSNWVSTPFCGFCGQRNSTRLVSVGRMLMDALDDQLTLNSALPRTLGALFFRPGLLTSEYVAGRIARYIAPLRLYLTSSLIFFVALSFATAAGVRELRGKIDDDGPLVRPDSASVSDSVVPRPGGAANVTLKRGPDRDAALTVKGEQGARFQIFTVKDTANVPAWGRPLTRKLKAREDELKQMSQREVFDLVLSSAMRNAPKAMFLLLPVLALLLHLLYIRSRRFYVEHFVFALHLHALAFLLFTLLLIVPWGTADSLLFWWFAIYLLLAMKRVYGQGWRKTTAKYVAVGGAYFFVMTFGALGLALAALFVG